MTYLPDEKVKWIVIHYSATPIEHDVPLNVIDAMHRKRGYREFGYHIYIRKNGLVEHGRDLTRPGRFETGAHSFGENGASVGICFEGGVVLADLDKGFDTRTPAQIDTMIAEIDRLKARFPRAEVRGHRDMPGAATQCPGFDAGAWWQKVEIERSRTWLTRFIQSLFGQGEAA